MCNEKVEVYSRPVGFLRPVDRYNSVKRKEFNNRKVYSINGFNKQVQK